MGADLRAWMMPALEKLEYVITSQELTPEDRVKEIFDIQAQVNERTPLLEPMEACTRRWKWKRAPSHRTKSTTPSSSKVSRASSPGWTVARPPPKPLLPSQRPSKMPGSSLSPLRH